ncbi:MAG: acyl-ACP--UDP-N-acetylglucosamine O-acyltransferase [Pirellulales bacterium]|nr:acyl-ACP--UDP-N-acetylglucosamine O-acyltransferase [Pirellulales bacterium]
MTIHPLAVVHPQANVGAGVTIGPFAIVEADVVIGEGCQIAGHAVIKSGVRLGPNNAVGEGAILGGLPQHVRCPKDVGQVVIGANNTIREYSTIHLAMKPETATTLGDHNYLMAGAHVAHDCHLGNHVILANNALLAGHVFVGDRAFVSGAVAVHQFCRIGQMAMLGGHARVVRDVPPFMMIDGISGDIVGLNIVGLKRNGYELKQINQLKAAYRIIYRSSLPWKEMLLRLAEEAADGPAHVLVEFFQGGTRGFSQERRPPPGATLKLHREERDLPLQRVEPPNRSLIVLPVAELRAKAG